MRALFFFLAAFAASHFHAQTPNFHWIKPVYCGIQNNTLLAGIADLETDAGGNTYITGEFRGQLDFGSGITLTAPPNVTALFIARFSAQGVPQWAKSAVPVSASGISAFNGSEKIAVDGAGGLYWTANYRSNSVEFGDGIFIERDCSNDCQEGFLIKFSASDGTFLFGKSLRAAIGEEFSVAGIAADAEGNHYITGSFDGTEVWLQGGANIGGLSPDGYFTARYNASGGAEWVAPLNPNSGRPVAQSISISPDGQRIAIYGTFTDPVDFGNSSNVSSNAASKTFVLWYNTIGLGMGAGALDASESVEITDLKLDDQYRAWLTCNFKGNLRWEETALGSSTGSSSKAAVAVVTPNSGQLLPGVDYNGGGTPIASITLTNANTYFTAGQSTQDLQVPNSGTLLNQGCSDLIVTGGYSTGLDWGIAYGQNGCEESGNQYRGTYMDTDANGDVRLCGRFRNGADFGGNLSFTGNALWVGKLSFSVVSAPETTNTADNIRISPNPASERVHITLPRAGKLQIFNTHGQLMQSIESANPVVELSTANWPAGIYMVLWAGGAARLMIE